jgi:hypothetical protein
MCGGGRFVTAGARQSHMFVATALVGLIGGIVAIEFGQPPPTIPGASILNQVQYLFSAADLKPVVLSLYAVTYVICGLAAIATWVIKTKVATPLVATLAQVSFGLFIAIARAYLGSS